MASGPLSIFYQLAASCPNVCLECQGFVWQERRRRHIWWYRNDNCYVFEDGRVTLCIFFSNSSLITIKKTVPVALQEEFRCEVCTLWGDEDPGVESEGRPRLGFTT